jgi:hypothetical protein
VAAAAALAAVRFAASPADAASPVPEASGTAAAPCAPLAVRPGLAEPRAGDIYLRAGAATCDGVEVAVTGRGLSGIFTLSFALRYPPDLLRYEGYATGTLMSRGAPATAPLYLVRTPAPGLVAVTITRFAPDAGASVEGEATLLGLRFGRAAPGEAVIDFDRGSPGGMPVRVLGAAGETVAVRSGPGHGAGVTIP